MKVEVNSYLEGSKLHIDTWMGVDPALKDSERTFIRKVMDLEEQAIKDALIKLGWTPPPLLHIEGKICE